jgi:F-type H+-transporting ATPase subunit gamma
MEMVAAAKVNKVFRLWKGFTPYLASLSAMIDECVIADPDLEHPLVEKKKPEEEKILFLIITSDMGLCGSYNLDILRMAEEEEERRGDAFKGYFICGTKGIGYLRYRNKKIYGSLDRFFGTPDFSVADLLSGRILSLIESGAMAARVRIRTGAQRSPQLAYSVVPFVRIASPIAGGPGERALLPSKCDAKRHRECGALNRAVYASL